MEDYIVAVKTSEFGLTEGQDGTTKDGDDERFPIRVARVWGRSMKPVSRPRAESARGGGERASRGTNDPHSDPFPQCLVGQNEYRLVCHLHLPFHLSVLALLRPVFVCLFPSFRKLYIAV